MSKQEAKKEAVEETKEEASLLDQIVMSTRQTERSEVEKLMRTFTSQALEESMVWDRNLSKTIDSTIANIDMLISKQVTAILHDNEFQTLEGSWRGLNYLVKNSLLNNELRIRVLNAGKKVLVKDLEKASEFDQSQLFKKMYEEEYGTPGGAPYGALIGDYQIENNTVDINFLRNISSVAAAAFCPFITAAGPGMMGLESWEDLAKPTDLEKVFSSSEYARWKGFRDTEDSRFVSLVLPRSLARMPYGDSGVPIEAFNYQELELDSSGKAKKTNHTDYCWMNAAYVMGTKLTNAFSEFGWCTAIRGAEGGGKVTNLNTHNFVSDDGDIDMKCPTEIGITDRREAELSKQGFLPLCHYKNTDYAVFFGGQTTQTPKQYEDPDATANAEISARLPYLMATSRIAHYLKVMARDKIGSFMEIKDLEKWLNDWVMTYVNSNAESGQQLKSKFPLADAKVEVKEIPGKPGAYHAVAWLRPWLQLEELTASLRLVARIPEKS